MPGTSVNAWHLRPNLWPCSGIDDADGEPKAAREVWRAAFE